MRVIHVSSYDTRGGAARSAFRLHTGLLELGEESAMLVRHKQSSDPQVMRAELDVSRATKRALAEWKRIQRQYIDANRPEGLNTKFSVPWPGFDLTAEPAIRDADIIHLHWVNGFLGPRGIAQLQELGKPIVWTLHDQRPFTGGCHFSHGCRGFETDCATCPQLKSDPAGLTRAALADARNCVRPTIHIVAPSRWLADCARRSALFDDAAVDVIPYGIDTGVFQPRDRAQTRRQLGIDPNATVFLFAAADIRERRKGFHLLADMFAEVMQNPAFASAVRQQRAIVLTFGQAGASAFANLAVPVHALGSIQSDEQLAAIYSAADVLLLPSLEDNLPNVLLEAVACGTAVIGHRVGGIPDVIADGMEGQLTEAGDTKALATAVSFAAERPEVVQNWRAAAARKGAEYSLERQALAYRTLYESLPLTQPRIGSGSANERRVCPLCPPSPNVQRIFPSLDAATSQRFRKWFPFFGGDAAK